jgi:hypothetical protein
MILKTLRTNYIEFESDILDIYYDENFGVLLICTKNKIIYSKVKLEDLSITQYDDYSYFFTDN